MTTIDKKLTNRPDFLWGVNIHSSYYSAAYKNTNLSENIKRAADMGVKLIRTNSNAPQDELDATVRLCNEFGLKVMLVKYIGDLTVEENYNLKKIEDDFRNIAEHYNGKNGNGKIDYIQLHNETDLFLMSHNPNGGADESGYIWNEVHLSNVAEQFKAAVRGVKAVNTDIETVINFCWRHFGMLDYFLENGVEWDIVGHDWYGDMMNAYETRLDSTAYGIGEELYKRYGKKVLICESNYFNPDIHSHKSWDDTEPTSSVYDILIRGMVDAYHQDYVIGFTFYELIDELQFEKQDWIRGDEEWNREAHFGMYFADRSGNVGEPKPICRRIKKIIKD